MQSTLDAKEIYAIYEAICEGYKGRKTTERLEAFQAGLMWAIDVKSSMQMLLSITDNQSNCKRSLKFGEKDGTVTVGTMPK